MSYRRVFVISGKKSTMMKMEKRSRYIGEMVYMIGKILVGGLTNPTKHCLINGILVLLIGSSFLTTVIFWDYMAVNKAQGRAHNPAPYSFQDGRRQLRSLEHLFLPEEAASIFAVEPKDKVTNVPTVLPPLAKECYACSNAPQVCPELVIPSLIGERKPNTQDVPMATAEEIVFSSNQSAVRASVLRANKRLTDYLYTRNTSRELLDPAVLVEDEALLENYNYLPGGHWIPATCLPRWKVAIIVPYRNRSHHLPVLLYHLIPFLQRQRLEFGIYVIEQANDLTFNRAMLMNVGFLEALNFTKWDCFIFHDVDHLPKNDHNYYGCSAMPRHLISGSDRWNYKLPYDHFFGAVTGLTTEQIRAINGFPNVYWGWGGEDDEIWRRCKETGLDVVRVKGPTGHYDVITHHHHSAPPSKERNNLLKSFKPRFQKDGLINIAYSRPAYTIHPLYTNISVNIQRVTGDFVLPQSSPRRHGKSSIDVARSGQAISKIGVFRGAPPRPIEIPKHEDKHLP